jgi:hypothetical protein
MAPAERKMRIVVPLQSNDHFNAMFQSAIAEAKELKGYSSPSLDELFVVYGTATCSGEDEDRVLRAVSGKRWEFIESDFEGVGTSPVEDSEDLNVYLLFTNAQLTQDARGLAEAFSFFTPHRLIVDLGRASKL